MLSDLRGAARIGAPVSVLEDPSGRRGRRMRRVGRGVALLFLLWILVLILGGLGLIPAADVPLGGVLRPSSGPPELSRHPTPAQPTPDDLVAARPLHEVVGNAGGGAGTTRPSTSGRVTSPHHGGVVTHRPSGQTTKPGNGAGAPGQTATPGNSGGAPGQTTKPGNSGGAPGQTTKPGNSGGAPGQTTTPGSSGSAPGRTTTTPGDEGGGTSTIPPPQH